MAKAINATNYAIKVGEDFENYAEGRWNKKVEEATKAGEPTPVPDRVCTFVVYEAETPADFAELAPSDEVSVNLWNRGASLKQLTEIRELMTDPTFEIPSTPYDLKDVINRATERRKATAEDKVKKLLADLDEGALERVMAALMAQSGGATQQRASA